MTGRHPALFAQLPGVWVRRAACGPDRAEAMYPDRSVVGATAVAKRVCRGCPVRVECREYAMATESQSTRFGVWGGLTPSERSRLFLRRRKRRASRRQPIQHGTPNGARAHYRREEPLCEPCRHAHARDIAERRAKTREAA